MSRCKERAGDREAGSRADRSLIDVAEPDTCVPLATYSCKGKKKKRKKEEKGKEGKRGKDDSTRVVEEYMLK